jgi:hypothetical protein
VEAPPNRGFSGVACDVPRRPDGLLAFAKRDGVEDVAVVAGVWVAGLAPKSPPGGNAPVVEVELGAADAGGVAAEAAPKRLGVEAVDPAPKAGLAELPPNTELEAGLAAAPKRPLLPPEA